MSSLVLGGVRRLTRRLALVAMALWTGCGASQVEPAIGCNDAAPLLDVRAHQLPNGYVQAEIDNRSACPLELAFGAEIQVLEMPDANAESLEELQSTYSIGPRWFFLTEDCAPPIPHGELTERCVRLEPGQTLRPIPWTGQHAMVQCPRGRTPSDFVSPAATFAVVVTACGGGATFRSAPFHFTSREL